MSQLTTHILDTTRGTPGAGITTILYQGGNDEWTEIRRSVTGGDGRIKDLLMYDPLQFGIYKFRFETKDYFDRLNIKTFYPYVEVIFEVDSLSHYHIPLLLSPFGYSTYRGS